jgi:fibronectin type 3 domain-containing protein
VNPAQAFYIRKRDEKGTMKRRLTIWTILGCCVSFSLGQGIQGNVKLTGKAIVVVTGHAVNLSWKASPGATSYCVYRGIAHGQYTKIASGIQATGYADVQVTHNQTLYYVTTAVNGSNESGYSNEIVAAIP